MREINTIVIHCSATPPSMDIGADTIRQWHLERGWVDIGYHFVIKRSGKIELGRPIAIQGAHVQGHNADSIGVCYVGGVDADGDPDDNRTLAQRLTMEALVMVLKSLYSADIKGHRDFNNNKACPSFDVGAWIESLN